MRTSVLLGTAVAVSVALAGVPAEADLPEQMRASVQPVDRGERPRVRVTIPVPDGVEDPTGRVLLEVLLPGGGHRDERRRSWTGADLRFTLDRVRKPGRYVVRAMFAPHSEGMRGATARASFRVRR
jgi:hypothetical protein